MKAPLARVTGFCIFRFAVCKILFGRLNKSVLLQNIFAHLNKASLLHVTVKLMTKCCAKVFRKGFNFVFNVRLGVTIKV